MTVRIGERAHVAPRLAARGRDDGRCGLTRPSDQIVDGGVGPGGDADDALAGARLSVLERRPVPSGPGRVAVVARP
jgi:hypothetical protein